MKPEKARGVEDVVLRAAQMGQIVEKVWPRLYGQMTLFHYFIKFTVNYGKLVF